MTVEPWLLFTQRVPATQSSARVRAWRSLREIGALSTRNAVYILPNLQRCRDDFERVRVENLAAGGEATVFVGRPLDASEHDRLIELFRRTSSEGYRTLIRSVARLRASVERRHRVDVNTARFRRTLDTLRSRADQVRRRDVFHAPGRADLEAAVRELDEVVEGHAISGAESPDGEHQTLAAFQGRRWVTRPRPGVDRMASAWLIRRYIDPRATFAFVDRPGPNDVTFDMPDGDFTHQGGLCTFETLADRFGLRDAAIGRLALLVHDLDLKDDRYRVPEAAAVGRLIDGLRIQQREDAALLEQGIALFDALGCVFR